MDETRDLKAEKARLERRVKHLEYLLDGAERKAERRRKHIERIEEACHELRRRNRSLGDRLMPDGMEWPRYESGEQVRPEDHVQTREGPSKLRQVCICREGFYLGTDKCAVWYRNGERVKRPEPKVPAADGEPLEVGQTVWHVDTGVEYTVRGVTSGGAHLSKGDRPGGYCRAEYLTHERPDTWERIEEDAEKIPCVYFGNGGGECSTCPVEGTALCTNEKARDLVRRCRALSEKGAE